MLISIIVPTYNVAQYVVECLDSIAAQTYQGDVECIIVDDCSTDDTREVVEKWQKSYRGEISFSRVNLKENGGLGNARNVGLDAARGDWILFVDSDDAITPNCLEVMTKAVKGHSNADFVYCNMQEMGSKAMNHPVLPEYVTDRKWLMKNTMFSDGLIQIRAWNKLIRLACLEENQIRFIKGIIHEDVSFSCQLSQHSKAACFCPQSTYLYRVNRPGSIINTSSKKQEDQFRSRLILTEFLLHHLTKDYRPLQLKSLFDRILTYTRITDIKLLCRHISEERALERELLQEMKDLSKVIASCYFALPLRMRRNKWLIAFCKKMNYIIR